ncbi:MAG: hypothetical protein RPT11_10405, partial [Bermanella sp.]
MDASGSLHGRIDGDRKLNRHHFRLAGKAQWYDFNFNAIALLRVETNTSLGRYSASLKWW